MKWHKIILLVMVVIFISSCTQQLNIVTNTQMSTTNSDLNSSDIQVTSTGVLISKDGINIFNNSISSSIQFSGGSIGWLERYPDILPYISWRVPNQLIANTLVNKSFNANFNINFFQNVDKNRRSFKLKDDRYTFQSKFWCEIQNGQQIQILNPTITKTQINPTTIGYNITANLSGNWLHTFAINQTIDENGNQINITYVNSTYFEPFNLTAGTNITCFDPVTITSITNCINASNSIDTEYHLTQSVNGSGSCMRCVGCVNVTFDCHGYTINFSENSNVNYGFNMTGGANFTTIRSCNIFPANADSASQSIRYNEVVAGADNNIIITNNTLKIIGAGNSNGIGVYIVSTSISSIINASLYSNSIRNLGDPILLHNLVNYKVYDNVINGTGATSLLLSEGSLIRNGAIYNNNITLSSGASLRDGILMSSGNAVTDNTEIYNNNIFITSTGTTLSGIRANTNNINNISIHNNNITLIHTGAADASQSCGINFAFTLNNSFIYSNNITSTTLRSGICLSGSESNLMIYNNTLSTGGAGFYLNGTSINGRFNRNNTFINNTISNMSAYSIVINGTSQDNFFINNNLNISRIYFDPNTNINSNLTIQWYLDVNVTNATNGNAINKAQVIINNSFGNNISNLTTDTNGQIPTQIITEFTMNGSVAFNNGTDTCRDVRNNINITCFTPYNISVSTSDIVNVTSIDINRSKFINFSFGVGAGGAPAANSCTYTSGDWNVLCSDNCVISSPVNVNGNNIYITGTGSMTINSLISNFKNIRIQGTDINNKCYVRCSSANSCFRK